MDPMDGLHLALMQQQRDRMQARMSFRAFTLIDGLIALMLICGIVLAVTGSVATAPQMARLGMGLLLVSQACYLWVMLRLATRKQLRKLDAQIEAETQRPDGPAIVEAAAAARAFILKQRGDSRT
jgi:hypothetical protein